VIRSLVVLIAAGATLATPALASAQTPASDLFTVSARSATLTPAGGAYRLALGPGVGPVTHFTDRPQRLAGRETLATFVQRWAGRGFTTDPPNANLVVDTAGGRDGGSMVLELRRPRVDHGRLTFTARRIGGDRRLPRHLGATHVFIDDASSGTTADLTLQVSGPGQATMSFDSTSTVILGPGNDGVVFAGIGGTAVLPNQVSITATTTTGNAVGGLVGFAVDASGSAITGTLALAPGQTATIQIGDGPTQPLAAGPFSLPVGS
jgi:hypothetical protein